MPKTNDHHLLNICHRGDSYLGRFERVRAVGSVDHLKLQEAVVSTKASDVD